MVLAFDWAGQSRCSLLPNLARLELTSRQSTTMQNTQSHQSATVHGALTTLKQRADKSLSHGAVSSVTHEGSKLSEI